MIAPRSSRATANASPRSPPNAPGRPQPQARGAVARRRPRGRCGRKSPAATILRRSRHFFEACPNAPQAELARLRLGRLQAAATPAPEPAQDPVAAPAAEPPAPPPAAFPREADYRAAQTELRRLRLYSSGIDGDWGPGSQRAMTAFQRQAGIEPADGALTELSLAALRLAPTPPEPEPTRPAATQPTPPPAATSAARAHRRRRSSDCPQCPEMIALRGGSFTMGSPDNEPGRDSDEGPQRRVTIAPFAIGKTEVTFAQWDACVSAGGCSHRPDDKGWGRGARPVMRVSWEDAQEYVGWLSRQSGQSYRLPSEAEWEYAARAGTTGRFSNNGDEGDLCSIANHADTSTNYDWRNTACSDGFGEQTAPVGSFAANPWGLYDMHGNVWEWVQDCWHDSYRGAPTDGSAWMSAGNGDCSRAVLRGGSWFGHPEDLRSADRFWDPRGSRTTASVFELCGRSGSDRSLSLLPNTLTPLPPKSREGVGSIPATSAKQYRRSRSA